jgi:hypothetical protein
MYRKYEGKKTFTPCFLCLAICLTAEYEWDIAILTVLAMAIVSPTVSEPVFVNV